MYVFYFYVSYPCVSFILSDPQVVH
jgi:hypothetical protein